MHIGVHGKIQDFLSFRNGTSAYVMRLGICIVCKSNGDTVVQK